MMMLTTKNRSSKKSKVYFRKSKQKALKITMCNTKLEDRLMTILRIAYRKKFLTSFTSSAKARHFRTNIVT